MWRCVRFICHRIVMADIKIKINAIAISLLVLVLIAILFLTINDITSAYVSLVFSCLFACMFSISIYLFVLTVNILIYMFPNASHGLGLLHCILGRSHSSQRAHVLVSIFIIGASFQLFGQLIRCFCLGSTAAALLALLTLWTLVAESRFLLSAGSGKSLFWLGSTIGSLRCRRSWWVCVLLIESSDKRRSRGC